MFYEWVMIADHNDTEEQALALVTRLQELPPPVNLIQLNPTADSPYRPASSQALDMFAAILGYGYAIPHTVRQRRGGAFALAAVSSSHNSTTNATNVVCVGSNLRV